MEFTELRPIIEKMSQRRLKELHKLMQEKADVMCREYSELTRNIEFVSTFINFPKSRIRQQDK